MSTRGIDVDRGDVYYPKFHEGEDLLVLVGDGGYFRFEASDQSYIDADNVVYVDDWV